MMVIKERTIRSLRLHCKISRCDRSFLTIDFIRKAKKKKVWPTGLRSYHLRYTMRGAYLEIEESIRSESIGSKVSVTFNLRYFPSRLNAENRFETCLYRSFNSLRSPSEGQTAVEFCVHQSSETLKLQVSNECLCLSRSLSTLHCKFQPCSYLFQCLTLLRTIRRTHCKGVQIGQGKLFKPALWTIEESHDVYPLRTL